MNHKIIRVTTIPESLKILLKGQLKYMTFNGFNVLAVSSSGKSLMELKITEGVNVYAIEMSRKITPFKDLISLFKFYLLLKRENPIIVHSHTPKAGLISMIASKLANIPIRLHTVAGLPLMEAKGYRRLILKIVEKITYKCATNIYPNSFGLQDFIINEKLTSLGKLKVIANGSSNGIDTSYFNIELFSNEELRIFKNQLGINVDDFIFIFVGRLVGDKGINELIQSFVNLKRKNIKLLLVGDYESELDPLLNKTLKEIDQNINIIPVGFQNDIRKYLAISNCLVFPSYREGFPNVVMQAGSMGLPCIVTDINGCNEIILEGINGTIIKTKNVVELTLAMERFLNDQEWGFFLKSNSRKMITTRFNQKFVWESILIEYKKLLLNHNFY